MNFPRTVYALEHAQTGRIYVGSSSNMKSRLAAHMSSLRRGAHACELMQKDYDTYGDGYLLIELDTIYGWDERHKEYDWMEELHTNDPEKGYNGMNNHFVRRPWKGKKEVREMTERLTTWNGSKYILPQGRNAEGKSNWREIAERPPAYENIGSPEEIEEKLDSKIKVIVKHPYLAPKLCEIDNICNEEGRLYNLPFNIQLWGVDFVGTIIIAGNGAEDFADVPDDITKKLGLYELI